MVVETKEQIKKFWLLPVLVVLAAAAMAYLAPQVHIPELAVTLAKVPQQDVQEVLWNLRHLDLIGQVVILLGGAFGVVVLVKEAQK